MSKKLNIFSFIILLLGQIVLGPMGIASAEGEAPEVVPPADPPAAVEQETPPPAPQPEIKPEPETTPEPEPSAPVEKPEPAPASPEQVEKPEPSPTPESKPEPEPTPETEKTTDSPTTGTPPGLADPPSDEEEENPWGGTVTVTKKDPNGKLVKGVEFRLTGPGNSKQYDKNVKTNENGVAFFDNVHHGKMTLTEIVPIGYEQCSTTYTEPFVIADEHSGKKHHNFTFVNAKKGECTPTSDGPTLGVKKIFEGSNDTDLDADFKLISDKNYSRMKEIDNGETKYFKDLSDGHYTLTETETEDDEGYVLIAPQSFEVKNGEIINGSLDSYNAQTKIVTIINKKKVKPIKPVKVGIVKTFEGGKTDKLRATFKLVCDDYTQSQTTDKYGKATFTNVPANSDCELTETSTPTGYQAVAPLSFETGTKDQTLPTIKNNKMAKPIKVGIVKTFEGGQTDRQTDKLKATFTLVCDDYTQSQTTDKYGKATFTNVPANSDCELTETSTPTGYQAVAPLSVKTGTKDLTLNKITNKKIPKAQLTVTKKYQSLEITGFKATFDFTSSNGYTDQTGVEIGTGGYTFTGLIPGTYTLTATASGSDDYDTVDPRTFVVDDNGYITETTVLSRGHHSLPDPSKLSIDVVNLTKTETPTGKITINKSFAELEAPYNIEAGEFATFELQDGEGNTLIGPKDTDENGEIIFDDLSYDTTYWLVETHAPEGYDIHPEYASPGKEIHIDEENNDEKLGIMNNKTGTPGGNPDPTGSITLYKHSSLSEDTPFNGVTFSIRRQSDDSVVREGLLTGGTTLGNGYLKVDGLPDGDYYFVETATIAGYDLNSTHYEFSIPYVVNDIVVDAIQEVRVPNIPTTPPTTPTGGGGGGPIILVPDPSPETPDDGDGEVIDPDPLPEEPGDGDGEIIDPDPLPEEPGDGDGEVIDPDPQPEAPGVTPQIEKPIKVVEQPRAKAPSKAAKVLPRTGESLAYDLLIVGLLTMLLGGWLLFGRRKRKVSKQ